MSRYFAGLCISVLLSNAALAKGGTLCTSAETPVFTCYTGGKIVSLCAAGPKDFSHLRYAYGTPGKVELSWPADGVAAKDAFSHGIISYSGSGGDYVRFEKGGFSFNLFYVLGSRGGFDGVFVTKGEKNVRNLICSEDSSDDLTTEFFQQAKLPDVADGTNMLDVPDVFFKGR